MIEIKRNVFLNVILIIAIFTIFNTSLLAQTANSTRGGFGYLLLGYDYLSLSNLNDTFSKYELPEASPNFINFGAGGLAIFNKLVIGGEGKSFLNQSTENDYYEINCTGVYGLFKIGYLLYSSNNLNFYPVLGIGGANLKFNVKYEGDENIYKTGGIVLDFSAHMDMRFYKNPKSPTSNFFLVGVKIGYIFAPIKSQWEFEHWIVPEKTYANINGPSISLILGAGRIFSKP